MIDDLFLGPQIFLLLSEEVHFNPISQEFISLRIKCFSFFIAHISILFPFYSFITCKQKPCAHLDYVTPKTASKGKNRLHGPQKMEMPVEEKQFKG